MVLALFACAGPVLAACRTGEHAVVEIGFGDPDGGLVLRSAPSRTGERVSVIPLDATDVHVGRCNGGWCEASYACDDGYVSAKYIRPQGEILLAVSGVSASDPIGLALRSGPGTTYPRTGAMPYDAVGIVRHVCQAGTTGTSKWCLVSYEGDSGWASSKYLAAYVAPPEPVNIPALPMRAPVSCRLWHWC